MKAKSKTPAAPAAFTKEQETRITELVRQVLDEGVEFTAPDEDMAKAVEKAMKTPAVLAAVKEAIGEGI